MSQYPRRSTPILFSTWGRLWQPERKYKWNTIFIGIIIETWCPTNVSVRHLAWPSHTVSGINLTKTKACSHSKMYYPKTASFFNLVFFPHSISHDLAWNICLFVCGLSPPPRMWAPRGEVLFGSQLYAWCLQQCPDAPRVPSEYWLNECVEIGEEHGYHKRWAIKCLSLVAAAAICRLWVTVSLKHELPPCFQCDSHFSCLEHFKSKVTLWAWHSADHGRAGVFARL